MRPQHDASAVNFLLLMEDYQGSYTDAYQNDQTLHSLPYRACAKRLFSNPIYYGDAYVDALTSHGFSAEQVVPLCRPLQFKWADSRRVWNPAKWMGRLPGKSSLTQIARPITDGWALRRILAKQIANYHPEFVWLFSGTPVTTRELRTWRESAGKVILWWSCPLIDGFPYAEFDLILTAIPALLSHFEREGIRTAHLPHAFDPRILERVPCPEDRIPRVAFVGSMSPDHGDRISFLDALSRKVPVDFYGYGEQLLPSDSPLRQSHHGRVWGDALYAVYGSHLIVIHRNIDVAHRSASAKRLFEATGMGACVVTENSDDIEAFFSPNREIVTYSDLEECVTVVKELLEHPKKARDIGKKGQERTLRDHTYDRRIGTLLGHLRNVQLM